MVAGMFTTSMSSESFSASLCFQWIKRTINKGSQMNGGCMTITQNKETVHCNIKIVNKIAKVKESMHNIADINQNRYAHIACSPPRIQKH